MLWYKSWLETRWRFVIGLGLLIVSAGGTVLIYPQVVKLLPLVPPADLKGEIGRQVKESIDLARSYRGYVWSQWFLQNMPQQWGLFAILLGSGGLLSQASRGGALFTLSLPVSRRRLIAIRAATVLGELFVLALVPSLMLPLFSPAVGQSYAVGDALVHAACLFVGGATLFSLAFLFSTVFSDVWRPALIVLCIAFALSFFEQVARGFARYGLFHVMSAEDYFRGNGLPWIGLLVSAALSAAMLQLAAINVEHRDF
jgi:ABC-type transport system involved in multi-copper enzyme maturation permease subunit